MIPLNQNLNTLKRSVIRVYTNMAREIPDCAMLTIGEPDFDTPEAIREAAIAALNAGQTHYAPNQGTPALRKAVADYETARGNATQPENVLVTIGACHALFTALFGILNPGDEVIIPTPAWVSYVEMVKLAEGKNVLVPATIEQDFKITPAQLEEAITERSRLIILCSPSNPTGSVYTKEELQALVDVLAKHPNVMILADEIYEHINFTGSFTSLASFPEIAERVIIVNGVSKAYAMTGWRIGFIAAPLWVAKATNKLQSQYTSGCSSIAQKAAEAAYTGSQECVEAMRQAFERRRDLVVSLAREIPGLKVNEPQGAFYLFPEVSSFFGKKYGNYTINNAGDLAMYLLEEGHVATVDGEAFCAPGYIRLSYATSDDNIREAMRRIAEALAKLS